MSLDSAAEHDPAAVLLRLVDGEAGDAFAAAPGPT
jgi:hypothetical protein